MVLGTKLRSHGRAHIFVSKFFTYYENTAICKMPITNCPRNFQTSLRESTCWCGPKPCQELF